MKDGYLAIYLRISDDDGYMEQDKMESASIQNQREVLRYFISKNNELSKYPVKEFLDDGFSGVNFNRPGIQKLLREVREGKVSCIIVKDLSRFGRNYIEVGDYIEQIFPFLGVWFLSVTDNYDSFKNLGGIEVGFKNLIHDLYSRDLSKKIKSVKKMYQEKGMYSGGDAPFGYKKPNKNQKTYQPDEEAANIVKKMFVLAAQGYTMTKISEYLNHKSIPTPGAYKNQTANENYRLKNHKRNLWTPAQVREIILNETYIGTFICHKTTSISTRKIKNNDKSEYIKYENSHVGLVDKELFEAAGRAVLLRGKRGAYKKNENLHALKGKVKCGHCGYSMNSSKGVSNKSYSCRMGNSCGSHLKIEIQILEKIVLEILNKLILFLKDSIENKGSEGLKKLKNLNKIKEEKQLLEMKIEHCKSFRMILYHQWKENQITKEEYIMKREEFRKQETKFQNELEHIIKKLKCISDEQQDNKEKGILDYKTIHVLTKELADKLIERIDVYDTDRVEITWKFQDEYGELIENSKKF